jgi:hypothetical protein
MWLNTSRWLNYDQPLIEDIMPRKTNSSQGPATSRIASSRKVTRHRRARIQSSDDSSEEEKGIKISQNNAKPAVKRRELSSSNELSDNDSTRQHGARISPEVACN